MELVVATNNKGKLAEIRELLPGFRLLTLADIGFTADIPEPYHTFAENAHTKALAVHQYCGKAVMADDSGICVDVLDGAPGVHSARYAGGPANDWRNNEKLLAALAGQTVRNAHYKAVICLLLPGEAPLYFEGACPGAITEAPAGNGGFGYDPIFRPDGYAETFAQLPATVKHELSHRGEAVRKMAAFLLEHTAA